MQHVFLIGAKSLGAYGGYETFINKLTEYHEHTDGLQYHVAVKANGDGSIHESKLQGAKTISDTEFIYHNARCYKIQIPNIGPAQAIYYDVKALQEACAYIQKNNIQNAIVYIMACRIGPFIAYFYKKLHALGAKLYVNPDGHEWLRAKWSKPIRAYWKYSEQRMIKFCDLAVCDSINIEKYIHASYDGKGIHGASPKTVFIAYGAETRNSILADDDESFTNWLAEKGLQSKEYYLVVGRFVPENNYEVMIREFMQSKSQKKFAIITNVNDAFLEELQQRLQFKADPRIQFVGTVYNQELLMKIREHAFAYFHGHEVGGTNPSLLEALGSTKLNLLLNVGFNQEVAQDAALYWSKEQGNLVNLINTADSMPKAEIDTLGGKAKQRIQTAYSWQGIADAYQNIFMQA